MAFIPIAGTRRGTTPKCWWETAPDGVEERRAVVIWLPDLARVAWWIAEGEVTLALGYITSLEEPDEAKIERAKHAAAQRWWEIYT